MRTDVIDRWEGFEALAPRWNGLVERSRQNIPFLRHEWLSAWWRHFSHAGDGLRVILVYSDAGDLLAAAPMMLRQERVYGVPCRVLQLMVNDHSCRSGFIVDAACDLASVVEALWQQVTELEWDQTRLRDVAEEPEDGVLEALLPLLQAQEQRHVLTGGLYSPVLPLTGTWEAYEARLSPSMRRTLRRRGRKLEREVGPVRFETVQDRSPHLDRHLTVGLELEVSSWKGRAGTAIVQDPAVHGFYRELADAASEQGWLRLNFLFAGDRPVAFEYGLEYAGRFYLLKTGFDEQYHRCSPGQLLQKFSIADAYARGLAVYEFLGMVSDWKRLWADQLRVHRTLLAYGATARAWPPYVLNRLRRSWAVQELKHRLRGTEPA